MKEVRHKIMNKKYSDLFHSKIVIKYIYQLFTQYYQSDFVLLMLLFKKEFMAALYLKVLLG